MSKINTCDYCSTSISDEMENYAGKNEDYCCKRCDDAADNAYYSRPMIPSNKVYRSDLGSISMIPPSYISDYSYEIYCLEGDLFDDIERFKTRHEAKERIDSLLRLNTPGSEILDFK